MIVHFILLLLLHMSAATNFRLKRFLNSVVNNRIDVLEQSHSIHRNETNWMRTIVFASIISFGIIFLLVTFVLFYLCRRIRRHVQRVQTPTLNAIETSGLAHLHPLMPHLLTLLQQVHSSNSTQSPPSSLPYPSSSQLSTTPVPTWPNLTYPTTSSSSVPALKF